MESKTDVMFDDDEEGELINWKVIDGAYVSADTVLLIYDSKSGEKKSLKTSVSGVVTIDTTTKKGKILKKGMIVASLRACSHAIVIKDMCASCGKDLRSKPGTSGNLAEASTANVSMIHHVPELIVSDELARKIGSRDRELLLKAHKLVLLVDLDQTLIHTTNHTFKVDKDTDVLHYKLKGTDFYTKIRPYAREFLRRMAELYEMHIISYGERQYAHRIAEFLDPDKKYFGHRILSRDELFCAMYKTRNMQALFPCGDHMIVMIDDRPDVWQYSDALIQVKPYRFFKEIGDINAPRYEKGEPILSGSYAEQDMESEDDETLEYVAVVLTKVHSAFYELFDGAKVNRFPDLKGIISYLRKQVLRDCSIALSGIVPVGVDIKKTEAYRLCVQFGAVVTDNVNDLTTHVIAARWGTTKVREAQKLPNVHIVNPKWLFTCVERWEKADEKEFEVLKDEARSAEKGGIILIDEISRLPMFGKEALSLMTDEVDEALSEDVSDNDEENLEEKSLKSLSSKEDGSGKRRSERNDEEGSASSTKKMAIEKEEENESEKSSCSAESESGDDDMAADVERQFFAMKEPMNSTSIEGNALVSTIASNIQRLSQYVQQLEVLGGKIGSNDDGEHLRDQIAEVTSSANTLSKETNTLMKRLVELSNDQRYASTMKVHRERLMGDLIGVLNRLQVGQRNAVAKEKESMKAVAAQDQQVSHQIEQVNDDEQQERQQLQIQHQQHLTEIRERSEAMRQLDQDISDVTQVMKDLARIVHDQGEIMDSIEANVEHSSMQVQQGAAAVQRAVIYQQRARQKRFFLFLFLFALIFILILIAYFFTK